MKNLIEEKTEEILSKEDVFLLELGIKLPCAVDEIKKSLTENQKEMLGKLFEQGLVCFKWNDDIPHENYYELAFTFLGNLEVFKTMYSGEVNAFKDFLLANGFKYDSCLIDDFLTTCDLSLCPEDILTIERLEQFCNIYDRSLGK